MNDIRNQTEKLIITKTLIGGRLSAPTDSQHFLFNSDGSLCLASILRLVNGGFLVGKNGDFYNFSLYNRNPVIFCVTGNGKELISMKWLEGVNLDNKSCRDSTISTS